MTASRTLVTFLQAIFPPKGQPDALATFQPAHYDLGEQKLRTEGLFGLALLGHMVETGRAPNRFVLVGTLGSSWGRLMAHIIPGTTSEELAGLDDKSRNSRMTEADLAPWAERLQGALRDRYAAPALTIAMTVTGYASDADGQSQLIERIAAQVPTDSILTVDATHGLRHLPLLSVVTAMVLRRLKNVAIDGIYYGAWERREPTAGGQERTPVWRLDGLPPIADWLAALSAFDKDGDYGVFTPLLEAAGVDRKLAGNLSDAAFAELVGNFDEARDRLVRFRKAFSGLALSGVASLFRDELMDRISWVDDGDIYSRQRRFAFDALERGDAVRAATWGFEAFVSRLTRNKNSNPLSETHRKAALKDYFRADPPDIEIGKSARLREMRNRVAHAEFAARDYNDVYQDVVRLMAKRETCLEALRGYLTTLLPDAD